MKVPSPSLPPELLSHIAKLLLDDDVVDYISFRAVCRQWRLCAAPPEGLDSCFRPRRWILLSEGDDAKLDTSHRRRFLNVSTGRGLVLHLPELATFSVFSDSDGLLFLNDLSTHAIRLFNPFTRHLAHLPNYTFCGDKLNASFFRKRLFNTSISTGSCPTVMLLDTKLGAVCFAKPGDLCWNFFLFRGLCPTSMLCFRDQFYFANPRSGIHSFHFQERSLRLLIPLNTGLIEGISGSCYITEFNKEMLLLHTKLNARPYMLSHSVYRVDLESNRLVPKSDNADLAFFLGRRCFAFSLNGLPSIQPNSVYYCRAEGIHPLYSIISLYNMDEEVESSRGIADYRDPTHLRLVLSRYISATLPASCTGVSEGVGVAYLFRLLSLPQYLAAYCLSSY